MYNTNSEPYGDLRTLGDNDTFMQFTNCDKHALMGDGNDSGAEVYGNSVIFLYFAGNLNLL